MNGPTRILYIEWFNHGESYDSIRLGERYYPDPDDHTMGFVVTGIRRIELGPNYVTVGILGAPLPGNAVRGGEWLYRTIISPNMEIGYDHGLDDDGSSLGRR